MRVFSWLWVALAPLATVACEGPSDREMRGAERAIEPRPAAGEDERKGEGEAETARRRERPANVPERARIGARELSHLVDGEGRTLYVLTSDDRGRASTCIDQCARAWPPVLTREDPEPVGSGVERRLLGTITRPDGSTQATYAGWPLYTFEGDRQPGQITGQGLPAPGGAWYVISTSGDIVHDEEEASAK